MFPGLLGLSPKPLLLSWEPQRWLQLQRVGLRLGLGLDKQEL